jgi:hypothetical protein
VLRVKNHLIQYITKWKNALQSSATEVKLGFSGKSKAIPLQAWTGREDSRRLRRPDFKTVGI